MKVIDASGWQEDLDYDEVVAKGVEGVIIKISEGTEIDDMYRSHLENCISHGLKWGVYCFAHAENDDEARAEAEALIDELDGSVPPLGIWYDVEAKDILNCPNPTAVCSAFIVRCNEENLSAGIYASLSTLEDIIDVDQLADYVPYWVAQYGVRACEFKDDYPDKHLSGWQYTDREYIGSTEVDMNKWYD